MSLSVQGMRPNSTWYRQTHDNTTIPTRSEDNRDPRAQPGLRPPMHGGRACDRRRHTSGSVPPMWADRLADLERAYRQALADVARAGG